MSKLQFIELMQFPPGWILLDMYPDELFEWQASRYKPGHENGAEHDRNGAFHWWFRRNPSKDELKKLVQLAAADPDPLLGADLRRYIREAKAFDEEIARLEFDLFSGR
ncbi:hypothetical protein [Roseateles depolymerans]|uniref:hypothetical protein n=1 Tax=Roseateles depolymerans TaxID=76731 RepID=UPI00073D205D|nr:hypothetical protein [Roseateles depolymerans]